MERVKESGTRLDKCVAQGKECEHVRELEEWSKQIGLHRIFTYLPGG
jgi:hypothetical protein